MKGIVLAGGTGKRLKSLTKAINKHLLPVYDRPLIYYPLGILKSAGITDVIVVTNSGGHFQQLSTQLSADIFGFESINYVYQDAPLGTAHAIACCQDLLKNEPLFLVVFGDNVFEFCNTEYLDTSKLGATVFVKNTSSLREYAQIVYENETITNIMDASSTNTGSGYAITGILLLDQSCFEIIKAQSLNQKGELDVVDTLRGYLARDLLSAIKLEGFWIDAASSIDHLFQASQLVKQYGANKLRSEKDQKDVTSERVQLFRHELLNLEKHELLSNNLQEIESLGRKAESIKQEIAKMGLRSLSSSELSSAKFVLLNSLRSEYAYHIATHAGLDTSIIDGTILLAASPNFRGWDEGDIQITRKAIPIELSRELDHIRLIEKDQLEGGRLSNNRLPRLAYYIPDMEDYGRLRICLSEVDFFDYYAIWKSAHKPLEYQTDSIKSMAEIFCPQLIRQIQDTDKKYDVFPTVMNVQCCVLTSDKKIVLMQRSPNAGFLPSHWSASFEETMSIEDASLHASVKRGFIEEFGTFVSDKIVGTKILSLNFEIHSTTFTAGCFLETSASSKDLRNSWLFAQDKDEASRMDFIQFDLTQISDLIFSDNRLWHPSSRKRLIELMYYHYGIDQSLQRMIDIFTLRDGNLS